MRTPTAGGSSSCEFELENTGNTQPKVAVDCDIVERFTVAEDSSGDVVENWVWDAPEGTLTFQGKSCENLQDGYQRIYFFEDSC